MRLLAMRGIKPYLAFMACTLIWGSTFLFIRIGNETMPPAWGAALRLAVATCILMALLALRREPLPRGAALRTAVGFGICQFGLNFPLLYWAEKWVPSAMSSILFGTIPLVSALMARAFGLERLTTAKIGGAIIALAGIAIVFSGQLSASVPPLALLSLLLAVWVACLGAVILKRGPRQSAIGANAIGAAAGTVVCLLWSAVAGEPHALPSSRAAWFPILYLAVAGSVGAFVLWSWLVGFWPVSRTSYIAVVSPVVAVFLGGIVRNERLASISLAGSLLIWVGVFLGLWGSRSARPH